jgi:hypothetical protein
MRPTALASLALIATAACGGSTAGAPETPPPTRATLRVGNAAAIEMYTQASLAARVIPVSADSVWTVLPEVFETLDVPVTHRVPSRQEMGNRGYVARRVEGKRMNTYVDCGTNLSGQLANLYEVTLSVVVRLSAADDGGAQVETTVDAYGKPRTTSGNQVHCQSRETLEQRIGDLVFEKARILPEQIGGGA